MVMSSYEISNVIASQQQQLHYSMNPNTYNIGSGSMTNPFQKPQLLGERMAGISASALSTGVGALNLANTGMGIAGMFGIGMYSGFLGGMVGAPLVGGAIAAGGFAAEEIYSGVRERQMVNNMLRQRFGGTPGIGGGRFGRGFNTREMGNITTTMREVGVDLSASMEELVKVTDQTAQLGLYRSVQSAREFRTKFREITSSLREISQIMGTTMEGATQFFGQARQMGFFSGKDISNQLLQTRLIAGATGMSVGQVNQIGMMGTQMGRAMGYRGRTGTGAAQEIGANIATAVRTGTLSDEMLAEATGGLTGAEGVQALTASTMQTTNRWLSRGAGRVLLAAAWDPNSGGMNRDMVERIRRGELSFQEARRIARENISRTGGRRSEFFSQEERLRGEAMQVGGSELMMGMIESHLEGRKDVDLDDPIAQRFLRRRTGWSQSELEANLELYRNFTTNQQARRQATRSELDSLVYERMKEGRGVEGLRKRVTKAWQENVTDPLRQIGSDWVTAWSEGVEGVLKEFEGRVVVKLSDESKRRIMAYALTGDKKFASTSGFQSDKIISNALTSYDSSKVGWLTRMARSYGTTLGVRGHSTDELFTALSGKIGREDIYDKFLVGDKYSGRDWEFRKTGTRDTISNQQKLDWLANWNRQITQTPQEMGISEAAVGRLGESAWNMIFGWDSTKREKEIGRISGVSLGGIIGRDPAESKRLMDERVSQLMSRGKWERGILEKLTPEQRIALVGRSIESKFGEENVFSAPFGRLALGSGAADIKLTQEALAQEQEKNLGNMVSILGHNIDPMLSHRRIKKTAFENFVFRNMEFQSDEAIEKQKRLDRRLAGVSRENIGKILSKPVIRDLFASAMRGDPAAKAKLDLIGTNRSEAEKYDISKEDMENVRGLLDAGLSGDKKAFLATLNRAGSLEAAKDDIAFAQPYLEEAKGIRRIMAERGGELAGIFGTDEAGKSGYAQFKLIQDMYQRGKIGDVQQAAELEKMFLENYGGTDIGSKLAGFLGNAGVGGGLTEGLLTMADLNRQYSGRRGSDKSVTRGLLASQLTSLVGGEPALKKILTKDVMGQIYSGGDSDKILSDIWSKIPSEMQGKLGGQEGDALKIFLRKIIEKGAGGIDIAERKDLFGDLASRALTGTRLSEGKKEAGYESKSLNEFKDMNKYLFALVQGNKESKQYLADIAAKAREKDLDENLPPAPTDQTLNQ